MKRLLDSQVRALRPKQTKYRKSDGESLYVTVYPSGPKVFELRHQDADGRRRYEKIGDYAHKGFRFPFLELRE